MSSVMAREEPLIKQLARSRALVGGGSRPSRYAHNVNFKCGEKKGVAHNRVSGDHLNFPQVKPKDLRKQTISTVIKRVTKFRCWAFVCAFQFLFYKMTKIGSWEVSKRNFLFTAAAD